jgi:hypothetical protein
MLLTETIDVCPQATLRPFCSALIPDLSLLNPPPKTTFLVLEEADLSIGKEFPLYCRSIRPMKFPP